MPANQIPNIIKKFLCQYLLIIKFVLFKINVKIRITVKIGFTLKIKNIRKKLNKRVFDAIQMYVCEKSRIYVKVKLRNVRERFTENKINFMCAFFQKMRITNNGNHKYLEFILDFFDELKDDKDIYSALMDKKRVYLQNLQVVIRYEEQMKKSNIETLILQGVRVPFISREDTLKKIEIIDRISFAVFGKTEEPTM